MLRHRIRKYSFFLQAVQENKEMSSSGLSPEVSSCGRVISGECYRSVLFNDGLSRVILAHSGSLSLFDGVVNALVKSPVVTQAFFKNASQQTILSTIDPKRIMI